ncbi:hypothetical protein [Haemophilus haemolyticus]|uniref:Uncharacterized protein n=1 Tax=Haemophilus haemolyticus TaxID=726 RepID=A0A1B8PEV3_HAEHA|nr:hypothetical protein [Haemophilus haemolyticus]OBX47008.1 hypothetical protein A9Z62_09180 [Haemophilus haemolyticus]
MTKFVELDVVIPVLSNNQKLVGIRRKTIFVNVDNISYFEPIQVAYPQKVDKQNMYYEFYKNIIDRKILEDANLCDLNNYSELQIEFERMPLYTDQFMRGVSDLGFTKGCIIYFKSGLNPLGYDKPVYAITSVNELVK